VYPDRHWRACSHRNGEALAVDQERKTSGCARPDHHALRTGDAEWRTTLANEHVQARQTLPLQTTQRPQLTRPNRMHRRQATLRPANMHPAGGEMDIVTAESGKFLGAHAMGVCGQDSRRVPMTMAVLLGRLDQVLDPRFGDILLGTPLANCYIYFRRRLENMLLKFQDCSPLLNVNCCRFNKKCNSQTVCRSDATPAAASEGGSRAAGGKAALPAAERDARERGRGASTATN
jgi:hypothetical protein